MKRVRQAINRALAMARSRRMDRELDDEILAHLEMAERDAIAAGLSPEAARREARQRFGGVQQVREEHRDQRGAPWIENLTRDVRHGGARLVRIRRLPSWLSPSWLSASGPTRPCSASSMASFEAHALFRS